MNRLILFIAFFLSGIYSPALSGNNKRCGGRKNRKCAAGLCCSQWGYCGETEWHCNDGCQIQFGICNSPGVSSSATASSTTAFSSSSTATDPPTTSSLPIVSTASQTLDTSSAASSSSSNVPSSSASSSTTSEAPPTSTAYAYLDQPCGLVNGQVIKAYPGDGDQTKSGLCCSSSGFAGVTQAHCGTGCQPNYGRCGSSGTPVLNLGCVNQNDIAFSFDDGPSVITNSLLDYLKSVSVQVTFFVNGINSLGPTDVSRINIYDAASVAILQRAVADGHQICSHTWSHQSLIDASEYNATYEMTRLNQAFKSILGKIPTCVRPPFGNINDNAASLLQGLGYGPDSNGGNAGIVLWNLDPVDWDPSIHGSTIPAQIADELNEFKLQTNPQANLGVPTLASSWTGVTTGSPSTITLNHDVWANTADFRPDGLVLPLKTTPLAQQAIEYLKSRNFNLVRIDQCLGKPLDSMYRAPNPNDDNCGGNCFA